MQFGGDLPLCKRFAPVQSVALRDDPAFGFVKLISHDAAQLFAFDGGVYIVGNRILYRYYIHQRQHITVAVGVYRLVHGNVEGAFLPLRRNMRISF